MVLYLKEEIPLAEKRVELKSARLRPGIVAVDELLRYLPREAAGKADQPLGVLMQQRPVDAGLYIKPSVNAAETR